TRTMEARNLVQRLCVINERMVQRIVWPNWPHHVTLGIVIGCHLESEVYATTSVKIADVLQRKGSELVNDDFSCDLPRFGPAYVNFFKNDGIEESLHQTRIHSGSCFVGRALITIQFRDGFIHRAFCNDASLGLENEQEPMKLMEIASSSAIYTSVIDTCFSLCSMPPTT
uniref:Uncharacterized protein n=1 Tax=Parascaris univalens TaxID=6257 RepID=A0A914ZY36_PARUN